MRNKNNNILMSLIFLAFTLVLISSFILSLGPYFFGWNGTGPYWKLPFYYFYKSFSFFKGMRVPNRLQLIFYVPFAFFVSYGAIYLFEKVKKENFIRILFVISISILFIENYNLRSYNEKSIVLKNMNQIIMDLSFLKKKTILHFPIHIPELKETDTYTLNWNILTNANSLNGYSGYVSAEQFTFLIKMKRKLDEEALRNLFIINTDYVFIHKDLLVKDELKNYNELSKLYDKGKVYDKNNLIVLNLKKYNYKFNECNFDKDFSKELKQGTLEETNQSFFALVLKNNSNCYLPSIHTDKYKVENFNISNLYGNQIAKTVYYKLPVLIEPYQSVILSESNNDLRIE